MGEPKPVMYEMLEAAVPALPQDKPRYLMGVGSPDCLIEGVLRGVDMFDSVLPTRIARHGTVMTRQGNLTIRDQPFARDFEPIEAGCPCYTCRHFSRAYIRHLFKARRYWACAWRPFTTWCFSSGLWKRSGKQSARIGWGNSENSFCGVCRISLRQREV